MAANLMKYIATFAFLCGAANCLMEQLEFNNLIKPRCYNKTHVDKYLINGQRTPLSSSMESLISLIESFEQNYTQYSASDVAELFLRRFRIDGVSRSEMTSLRTYRFDWSADEQIRNRLLEDILFGSNQGRMKGRTFPEEAFSEEEKCALYYMLSHAIVNYTTVGINQKHSKVENNANTGYVEQGVVSLNNHEIHAIAPGRLLLGTLAGLRMQSSIKIETILKYDPNFREESIPPEGKRHLEELIDPVYAVTVGDVVVEEMLRVKEDKNSRRFGPNGIWNSTVCPTRYYLDSDIKPTKATYAAVRGAGDGLLLGLKANDLEKSGYRAKISSLLRMYYSKHGIEVPGMGAKYSYCERFQLWGGNIDTKIREQITNYARLSNIKRHGAGFEDNTLTDSVTKAMQAFENSKNEIVDSVKDAKCELYEEEPACESLSDIFFVMDNRGNSLEVETQQRRIVRELVNYLDIRLFGGSVTVMSSFRGYGEKQLEYIVYNTTSRGCVGCAVDWFTSQGATVDETHVFESINKTLMNYEKEIAMLPGVPGKALVYFNYDDQPVRMERNLKDALWDVENKHRDVPIFAIGKNMDRLKKFASKEEYAMLATESDTGDEISSLLRDKICHSFSTFQYPYCRERKSSKDDSLVYQGYVTPGYVQYWAMYPEYFLKSFDIKFYFYAEGGDIEVCHSRSSKKERLFKKCYDISKSGTDRVVEFSIPNPCKGKNVYNCDPFYFAIKGKTLDSGTICREKECKYLDQIKFTVRHEGVSCNSSSSLVSSLQAIISLLLLFCLVRKNV